MFAAIITTTVRTVSDPHKRLMAVAPSAAASLFMLSCIEKTDKNR